MTDNEILEAAASTYAKGYRPITDEWSYTDSKGCCFLAAACLEVNQEIIDGEEDDASAIAASILGTSEDFVEGAISGFDDWSLNPTKNDEYGRGYSLGVLAREKFLPKMTDTRMD